MANTKISQLPEYTGNTYDGFIVWNDSGETTTSKTRYLPVFEPGTGTDSIKSTNSGPVTGEDSIAIGANGGATAANSINIGGSDGATQFRTIIVGKNPGFGSGSIIVGNGSYSNNNAIVLGNETAAYQNCIVIGHGLDANRATANFAMTIGTDNPQNMGSYSVILGGQNRIGSFNYNGNSYDNGGQYNYCMSNLSRIGFLNATNYTGNTIVGGAENIIVASGNTNSIIGGGYNVISGATSGATLIGLNNFTSPIENDSVYVNNLQLLNKIVLINFVSLDYADDAAADAGGIPLGGIYHTSGAVKVRIT